jgi:enamine deaminase RidA (YjgF/YER057c/UK114 family)
MTLDSINPEEIEPPLTYSHVVIATGTRMVFIAGQVAGDKEGNVVDTAT